MDDRINAFLDDELSAEDRATLLHDASTDPALAAEVDRAVELRAAFRRLGNTRAPHDLAPAVLDVARRTSLHQDRGAISRGRHVFRGTVAIAMIVVAVMLVVPSPPPPQQDAFTEQEVAQALADVKLALGIVSDVGERTGRIVREEALGSRTLTPLRSVLPTAVGQPDNQQ